MKEKMNIEDIAKALGAKFIGFSPAPPMFVPPFRLENLSDCQEEPKKEVSSTDLSGCNSMVECQPSKLIVEGSSPFTRSTT
jgi:hypothetical protein